MIRTQHFLTALASESSQVVSSLWLSTNREGGRLSLPGKEDHLLFTLWTSVSILSLDIVVSQNNVSCCCCSVTKSCLTLWHQGLRHARLPYLSLSPRVCSNSCPLSQWCYLTISFSVACFYCLQSFPTSGSFPMSQLLASGGQNFLYI